MSHGRSGCRQVIFSQVSVDPVAPCRVHHWQGLSVVFLTTTVMHDSTNTEIILGGGTLVIRDMGVACTDKFDTINESDPKDIHEVIEQLTVSITKAGINTSLHARTLVPSTFNPAHSRYNRSRARSENINLAASLLSRLYLTFLLLYERNNSLYL